MGFTKDFSVWGDRLKRVYEVMNDAKNVEMTETIADLRIALSGWKIKFAEMEEESLELKAKIKELEDKLTFGDELVFREGAYYRANSIEGKPNGPFCPNCWESETLMVSLSVPRPPFTKFGRFNCPKCQAYIS